MLPGKDSFQFEWSLTLSLSKDWDAISTVELNAYNLICDDKFDPQVYAKLKARLGELGK